MERLGLEHGVPVPVVVDRDLDTERPWFVMPWFERGSLEEAVSDGRYRADPSGGIAVLRDLAEALRKVHDAGLAHRDVKPANILLGDSRLVLADFGLSLDLDDPVRITSTDEAIGSRLYIAPENEAGLNVEVDQRPADAYAFGKVAWAIMAAQQPPPRERALEAANQLAVVLADRAMRPLDRLLADLLALDPRGRLVDWDLVIRDLHSIERTLAGLPPLVSESASQRALDAARRIPAHPSISAAMAAQAAARVSSAWWRNVHTAMLRGAKTVDMALAELNELMGLNLSFGVTTGGAPTPEQLGTADRSVIGGITGELPSPLDPTSAAVCLLIHSSTGIPEFPSIVVRLWPSEANGQIWLNRLPMITPHGEPERIAAHLAPGFAARYGPLAPNREATIEEANLVARETAHSFITLCEEYLDIIDSGADPNDPAAWSKRQEER